MNGLAEYPHDYCVYLTTYTALCHLIGSAMHQGSPSASLALFGSEPGSGKTSLMILMVVLNGGMILLSLILCKIRDRYDVTSDQQDQV